MADRDEKGLFVKGNQAAANHYSFNDALRRAIDKKNLSRKEKMDILEEIAGNMLERALDSKQDADAVADRLDGKPKQQTILSGDEDAPLNVNHGISPAVVELLREIRGEGKNGGNTPSSED